MPTYQETYGYGKYTQKKLLDFNGFMKDYLAIVRAVMIKYRNKYWCNQMFHYIDMNAGPGILPDLFDCKTGELLVPSGTKGSPLAFTKWARHYRLKYHTDFIEINPVLASQLSCCDLRNVWNGDHNNVMPIIVPNYIKWKFGLIYHDPNNGNISFGTLAYCVKMRPTYEVLINFPGALFKRSPERYRDEILISDHMDKLKKENWLVKDFADGDIHQWTFLLGTNFDIKDFTSIGMYRITKPKGARIFERLKLNKRQLREKYQPSLF